jgi:ABC-type multidrug transport system fused ATPase/permease subunit
LRDGKAQARTPLPSAESGGQRYEQQHDRHDDHDADSHDDDVAAPQTVSDANPAARAGFALCHHIMRYTRRFSNRLRKHFVASGDGPLLVAQAPPVPVREIVRRFWPLTRPYRRYLWLGLLLVALVPVLETAQIWLFKLVVDDVLVPREFGRFGWIAGAYVGLTVLAGVVAFADDYVSTWIGERFLLSLRTRLFRHLQTLSLDFFERCRLGDLLARLTGDVSAIENFVLSGIADAIAHSMRILLFAGALFYLDWRLALVSLVATPLFWFLATRFGRLAKLASREKRRRSGSISAVAEESLANAALVQAYGREQYEVERFHRENLGSFEAQMTATRVKAAFGTAVDLIEVLGGLVVIGFGTWELARGRLSLGALLVFLAYLTQLYSPIRGLSRLANTIYSASAGAERIIELFEQRQAIVEGPEARSLPRARGVVELDGVTFRYPGAGRDALTSVSLRVLPGEVLALVGESGAGKSTIAKLLLRFYDPHLGALRLDGNDLRDLRLADVRANVALVLQETLVFDGSIRDNIAYGRLDASDMEVRAAAHAADADDFINTLPDGYQTVIGQRGRRLSGGQRQRVAIARALLRNAPVLVLDEPTTGLGAASSRRILGPLRRLMSGRTAIVISHNLLLTADADWIVFLDQGMVAEEGSHQELLARDGLYAHLYRLHNAGTEVSV